MNRLTKIIAVFFVIFSLASAFSPLPSATAADWPGWNGITAIYYNTAQEDPYNAYLATAAQELQNYLGQMAGRSFTITHSSPTAPAIYIVVNPSDPNLTNGSDEAFRLVLDSNGVTITGKTALACRHGAYDLLERLGVRWFFKSDVWTVVPNTLTSLGNLDVTDEPDWVFRLVWHAGTVNAAANQLWGTRNRMFGAGYYSLGHSYTPITAQDIAIGTTDATTRNAYWNQHPELFLPTTPDTDYWPWQLNPANPTVIAWATQYAEDQLARAPAMQGFCPDVVEAMTVPISPNDGGGFSPPYSDYQEVTDLVFGLVKDVAENIAQEYPDKYVSCYSYAQYSQVPSFDLPDNILVEIATNYNYGDLTLQQQVDGYASKGVLVGLRDYIDIWGWFHDTEPMFALSAMNRIKQFAGQVSVFNGESGDAWCGRTGLSNYIASKLLWDSSLEIQDILDDFYANAFGAAASVMESYYDNRGSTTEQLATSFSLLNTAESLLANDQASLARVRHLQYYTRFLWKYPNISSMSLDDLKSFYTFLTKIRDQYIVFYVPDEEVVRTELTNRGLTSTQIDALQNFTPPTAAEAQAMMNEALAVFGVTDNQPPVLASVGNKTTSAGQLLTFTVSASDPESGTLTYSAGNLPTGASFNAATRTFSWTPTSGQVGTYANVQFIVSDGSLTDSEYITITVNSVNQAPVLNTIGNKVVGAGQLLTFTISATDPESDTLTYSAENLPAGASFNAATRSVSWMPTAGQVGTYANIRFVVSDGSLTDSEDITITVNDVPSGEIEIGDPAIARAQAQWSTGYTFLDLNNPAPCDFTLDTIKFQATSPLTGLKVGIFYQVSGTTYRCRQSVTIGAAPAGYNEFSGYNISVRTGDVIGAIFTSGGIAMDNTGGSVGMRYVSSEVIDQNDQAAFSDFISGCRLSLSGSGTSPGTSLNPDVNGDGMVNILDVIILSQHWGETGASGWIPEDIIQDGVINVLDLMRCIMYWTG